MKHSLKIQNKNIGERSNLSLICPLVIYWVMYFVLHKCNDTVSVGKTYVLKKHFGNEYFNIVIHNKKYLKIVWIL